MYYENFLNTDNVRLPDAGISNNTGRFDGMPLTKEQRARSIAAKNLYFPKPVKREKLAYNDGFEPQD